MKERIQEIIAKRWVLPAVSGVAGLGVGFAVGYMRTRSQYDRIEEKMDEINKKSDQLEFDFVYTDREDQLLNTISELRRKISSMEKHPSIQEASMNENHQVDMDVTEPLVEKRLAPMRSVRLVPRDPEDALPVAKNVFDNAGDEWDYKVELEARDKTRPYIIHVDEFVADEMGWGSQSTLTWYEGDQVLCDEQDKPIYNHSETVGELRFGHGSNDANVVYIRNEKLQSEFEVLRDTDSYENVVLGKQMERMDLKHSQSLRKFRDD